MRRRRCLFSPFGVIAHCECPHRRPQRWLKKLFNKNYSILNETRKPEVSPAKAVSCFAKQLVSADEYRPSRTGSPTELSNVDAWLGVACCRLSRRRAASAGDCECADGRSLYGR